MICLYYAKISEARGSKYSGKDYDMFHKRKWEIRCWMFGVSFVACGVDWNLSRYLAYSQYIPLCWKCKYLLHMGCSLYKDCTHVTKNHPFGRSLVFLCHSFNDMGIILNLTKIQNFLIVYLLYVWVRSVLCIFCLLVSRKRKQWVIPYGHKWRVRFKL